MQRYFEGLGFQIPEHTNPADAFLDIISGTIKPRTGEKVDLPAAWKRHTSATSDAAEGGAAALTLHTGNWSTDITQPRGKTLEDDDALPGILSLQRVSCVLDLHFCNVACKHPQEPLYCSEGRQSLYPTKAVCQH